MDRLKKRADFLRAAGGAKWAMPGFVLQARPREHNGGPPRAGFTASRKVGGAVSRNRARRRLKELARLALAGRARPGHDYVLIARRATLAHPFGTMLDDLDRALHMVHQRLDAGSTSGPSQAMRNKTERAPGTP